MQAKSFVFSGILTAVSIVLSLTAVELLLQIKNSSMTNYDIEMWRHAKELKVKKS